MKPQLLLALLALCFCHTAAADTFTVKNTNATGADSLAQAIVDANGQPNTDADTPDRIEFDIPISDPNRNPTTGVFTITPAFPAFAPITDPVVIDGYTQGSTTATTTDDAKPNTLAVGNNAILLIELDGTNTGGVSEIDFRAGSDGSTVRGLIINRCSGAGISIATSKVKVLGNFIGTDSAGAIALGNNTGILSSGDGGNQIGTPTAADRNLISGNFGNGLSLTNRNDETNTVQNNYIGVKAEGNSGLPNARGILISSAFGASSQGPTQIGGATSTPGREMGNVISGNTFDGIFSARLAALSLGQ